jgi:flagellar motility protein MotE (MotC chaperone)
MNAKQPGSGELRGGDPHRAGLVPMPSVRAGRRGRKRGAARGALVVIAGLLLISAAIRVGLGLNGAIALETGQEAAAPEPASDAANMALLAALQAREDRLAKAEAAYEDRRQALALAEKTIDEKLGALTAAEAALSATIARAETASEDDLAKLTAVYENMKPADAAAVFEAMSPDFAAGFLGRMRPEAAAGVMAGLTPETAYSISVLLAGRNAGVPKR